MKVRLATALAVPLFVAALLAAGSDTASASPSAAPASADKPAGVLRLHRTAQAGSTAVAGPDVINCYLTVNTPRKEGTSVPRQIRVYAAVSCDYPIDAIQIGVGLHFAGVLLTETFMAVERPDTNYAFADSVPTNCGVGAPFQGEAYAIVYNAGYTDEGGAFGPEVTFSNCI